MKIKLLVLGLVLAFASLGVAMSINKTEVPQLVKDAFAKKYPTAQKVQWEMEEPGEYEAEFKLKGKKMSANFTADGAWLETETEMKTKDLPSAVKESITLNFPGYETEEVEQIETPDLTLAYEVELENEEEDLEIEVIFSVDGTVIEKKADSEDEDTGDDDEDKGE